MSHRLAQADVPTTHAAATFSVETLIVIGLGALFTAALIIAFACYRRCPPDKIMVIYGRMRGGRTARCMYGGGAFVLPLLQECAYLSVSPFTIPINLVGTRAADTRLDVAGEVIVGIGTDPERMYAAAEKLLGLSPHSVRGQATEVVISTMRQSLETVSEADARRAAERVLEAVAARLTANLAPLGMELIHTTLHLATTGPRPGPSVVEPT